MRRLLNTITKARTGAQTIGSLTISASLPVNTETYDLGVDEESVPACKTELLFCESLPVESKARSRMVIGTTVRLMTRLAIAIGMALSPPKRSPGRLDLRKALLARKPSARPERYCSLAYEELIGKTETPHSRSQ